MCSYKNILKVCLEDLLIGIKETNGELLISTKNNIAIIQGDSLKMQEYKDMLSEGVIISGINVLNICENCKNNDKNMCKYCDGYGALDKDFSLYIEYRKLNRVYREFMSTDMGVIVDEDTWVEFENTKDF